MESTLTPLEMDAVLQLIQLSVSDSQVFWLKLAAAKGEETEQPMEGDENREESVGETTSSSTVINPEKLLEEALPRRRKRFLPIADIYRRTKPLIANRSRNRNRNHNL